MNRIIFRLFYTMIKLHAAIFSLFLLFSPELIAQTNMNALIATWKLVSARDTTDKGEVIEAPYGKNPTGFLTYSADGRMMAIITNDGRKFLSGGADTSPVEEMAAAFATLIAYAGRYTVEGDKVIHHLDAAWVPNVVNRDLVRFIVKVEENRLTLRAAPFTRKGVQIAQEELVWERIAQ